MIEVGIHENVRIIKVEMKPDPKGDPMKESLVITVKAGEPETTGAGSFLSSMSSAETRVSDGNLNDFLFFPYDEKEWGDAGQLINSSFANILAKIKEFKAFLNNFLSGYVTSPVIEAKWNVILFEGTGVENCGDDEEAIKQLLMQPAIINKVFKNTCKGFIELITPHIGPKSDLFRMKTVRNSTKVSKTAHFPRFPKFPTFWEPMSVPKASSKVAYNKYEKDNKLNDPTPSEEPSPDVKNASGAAEINQLFGLTPGS